MVLWLRLWASNATGAGLIPGQGTKTPYIHIYVYIYIHYWVIWNTGNWFPSKGFLTPRAQNKCSSNHTEPLNLRWWEMFPLSFFCCSTMACAYKGRRGCLGETGAPGPMASLVPPGSQVEMDSKERRGNACGKSSRSPGRLTTSSVHGVHWIMA